MVEFSTPMGCFIWTCLYGHMGLDFEGEHEALEDFKKHQCALR